MGPNRYCFVMCAASSLFRLVCPGDSSRLEAGEEDRGRQTARALSCGGLRGAGPEEKEGVGPRRRRRTSLRLSCGPLPRLNGADGHAAIRAGLMILAGGFSLPTIEVSSSIARPLPEWSRRSLLTYPSRSFLLHPACRYGHARPSAPRPPSPPS